MGRRVGAAATMLVVALVAAACSGNDDAGGGDIATGTSAPFVTPTPTAAATPAAPEPTATAVPEPSATATPSVPAAPNDCPGHDVPESPVFVWNVLPDDPDGGLVGHTQPGVDAPVTRILLLDEVATPTGGCAVSSSGSFWYELGFAGTVDWASSRFLQATRPACLFGEQFGSRLVDGQPTEQIFGPLDGFAVEASGRVAFAPQGATSYRWYQPGGIVLDTSCFSEGPAGPVCLTGEVRLIDFTSPEPVFTGSGPLDAATTGRIFVNLADLEFVEVALTAPTGDSYEAFVRPDDAALATGPCQTLTYEAGPDDLSSRPCLDDPGVALTNRYEGGTGGSGADHVHDLRVEEAPGCTRIVVVFGRDAGNAADSTAATLPTVEVGHDRSSADVRVPGLTVDFDDAHRVNFAEGVALVALDTQSRPYVQLLYTAARTHVTFLEGPARVLIDLVPISPPGEVYEGPVGENFVLVAPLQPELTGPGIAVGVPLMVTGFGRPFEAQGSYRIYAWNGSQDPLADPAASVPEPTAVGAVTTTGWVDGWGRFDVTLPDLAPGIYTVLFGDEDISDANAGFIGTGQVIRIYDPQSDTGPALPLAQIIHRIELPA